MHVYYTTEFIAEQKKYKLAFTCEQCQNYSDSRQSCALSYPVKSHSAKRLSTLTEKDRIFFCKMFEAL